MEDLIVSNSEVCVPEEGVTLDFTVTEEKPFNKCFECRAFRTRCSGPNPLNMPVLRACEYFQMARVVLSWSYQRVADETERIGMALSLTTVKHTLTGKNPAPSFYTMSALSIVLIGVPDGTKYPCAYPDIVSNEDSDKLLNEALRDLERLHADTEEYRAIIDNIHRSYKAEMDAIREDAQAKINYLKDTCDRLRSDRDGWRAESDRWQAENERKAKLIDKHLDRMLGV